MGYSYAAEGGNSEVAVYGGRGYSNGVVVRLFCDNVNPYTAYMTLYFPPLNYGVIGFASKVAIIANSDAIFWKVSLYKPNYLYTFWFMYEPSSDTFQLYHLGSGFITVVSNLVIDLGEKYYNYVKLTVNTDTVKYDKVIVNNIEYDVSDYSPMVNSGVVTPSIEFQITSGGSTGIEADIYVDTIIITQAE